MWFSQESPGAGQENALWQNESDPSVSRSSFSAPAPNSSGALASLQLCPSTDRGLEPHALGIGALPTLCNWLLDRSLGPGCRWFIFRLTLRALRFYFCSASNLSPASKEEVLVPDLHCKSVPPAPDPGPPVLLQPASFEWAAAPPSCTPFPQPRGKPGLPHVKQNSTPSLTLTHHPIPPSRHEHQAEGPWLHVCVSRDPSLSHSHLQLPVHRQRWFC